MFLLGFRLCRPRRPQNPQHPFKSDCYVEVTPGRPSTQAPTPILQRGSWRQTWSASLIEPFFRIRVVDVQMSGVPLSENRFPDGFGAETPEAVSWRCLLEEKADLVERVRGLARIEAMREAYKIVLAEWLNRQPVRTGDAANNRCLWCGKFEKSAGDLRPFGSDARGVAWLHPDVCWRLWKEKRRAGAVAALQEIGIAEPAT
jgi:hypothetical protein